MPVCSDMIEMDKLDEKLVKKKTRISDDLRRIVCVFILYLLLHHERHDNSHRGRCRCCVRSIGGRRRLPPIPAYLMTDVKEFRGRGKKKTEFNLMC